jgi:ABC-type transport system involved in multi-copper enzyme maturation permease subunit
VRVGTIAVNTFRETIRDRILYSLLMFAILLIGLSYFIAELSLGDFERVVINVGLACVHFFGAIIAIFVGITLVSKEVEKKTIYAIVSKPVSRFEFLIGKFSGLSVTIFLTNLAMTAGLLLTTFVQSGNIRIELLFVSLMIYLELLILTAVAMLFSSFTTTTLSAIFTLSIFFIGHLSPDLKYFGERANTLIGKYLPLGVYYILPNLENFNFKNVAVYGVHIDAGKISFVFLYFFFYLFLIILIANFIFSKRDFK